MSIKITKDSLNISHYRIFLPPVLLKTGHPMWTRWHYEKVAK